jgi:hypothetical protein
LSPMRELCLLLLVLCVTKDVDILVRLYIVLGSVLVS